ncbi:MAG: hypothetical protein SH868_00380, partial [Bythopirellula sp.]|nr:hypothetical protein [Bythopirellula sp.]
EEPFLLRVTLLPLLTPVQKNLRTPRKIRLFVARMANQGRDDGSFSPSFLRGSVVFQLRGFSGTGQVIFA